jgi:hypothetical protein
MPKYTGVPDRDGKIGEVRCCGIPIASLSYIEVMPIPDHEGTNIWMGKIVVPEILPVKHSPHIAERQASIEACVENSANHKRFMLTMTGAEFSEIPRGSRIKPGEKEYDISAVEDRVKLKPEVTGSDILSRLKSIH